MVVAAEPASGSVMPMQNSSPAAAWGSHRVAQRVVAQVLDGPRRAVEDELAQDGARHVDPGDLLEHDGGLDVAHAHAAVLLAHGDGEELGPSQGLERRLGELLGFVPTRRMGGDVALGHVPGQLAQGRPVVVLDEVDGAHDGVVSLGPGAAPVASGHRT